MKQTSRGLAPSLNTGHSTFTGARQRLAVALVAIVIAFAGAQTAGAQNTCFVTFDISGKGTVELQWGGEWLEVTNDQTIDCPIPYDSDLMTITPETGYVLSSVTVTHDATDELTIFLSQDDAFQWSLHIRPYKGSETPTITVHIVFGKAGGADEASAVALTADDDFHLAGGWYKVESDLTLGHTVNLHGDTHITIATGKTLTVSTSDKYGISGSALTVSGEGTLNVSANQSAISVDNYTQMGCDVTLSGDTYGLYATNDVSISGGSLTTSGADWGIGTDYEAITISGGTVSSSGELFGLWAGDAVSITGGTVSASGNVGYGIIGYSVSITGGQVTASSGGIWSTYGDITLGCTSATDYITASGFTLKDGFYMKIADGQTLYGGGFPSASYTGTVDDPSALNGLMLRPTAAVTESGTNEYTIRYADGWDAFCDRLAADDGKDFFSGKTVKLGADITVSRMAGSDNHEFTGTFDGGGHTLTFSHTATDNYCAPFRTVQGATAQTPAVISNLNVVSTVTADDYRHPAGLIALQSGYVSVTDCNVEAHINCTKGTVNTSDLYPAALVSQSNNTGVLTVSGCTTTGQIATDGKYAAGLVGIVQGTATITDCVSSVTIDSSTSGDGTHGGIVATVTGSGSIEGCVFNGKLTTTNGTGNCAGFIAWGNGTISNSLYAPADLGTGETEVVAGTGDYPSGTFYRGTAPTVTNSYYTRALGTAQGKATRTVAPAADVTIEAVALTGTATQYTVSGITAYSGGGLQRGETLYYGSDDLLSLTLSNSATAAPLGYQYGYTASAGTLSGTTLTMPDEDVTISTALAPIDWATVNLGDSEDPYMIYNKDQLLLLAHRVNGTNGETANTYQRRYFKLGADITFSHDANEGDDYAENYEAIGGYIDGTYRYFYGNFDGDGHTVSGIRIRKTGTDYADIYQGLFGLIGSDADIRNVHLTDARITGYENVGGIAGYTSGGDIKRCSVTDSYITATGKSYYGTICGSTTYTLLLRNNYYHGCTVNGTAVTSGKGCDGSDIAANNGALPAYHLALGANITTPPGTFAGQTEWLDTPPVDARLAPGNGFTLAGNHYFASGYEFTPGSTLASGAAQGYTPRATLGDELLDLYTHTGDAPDYTGTAIARLTVTADCDGKTLDAALRSTGQAVLVSYVDAGGTARTAQAIALDGTETDLGTDDEETWYFVGLPTVAFDHTLNLHGDVHLILADGCTMNVTSDADGIEVNGSLTIYGQTDGTGTLNATSDYGAGIFTNGGTITISGGRVTVTGGNEAGIYTSIGYLTIRGGRVTVNSRNGVGIITISGTITLGCTTASDFIKASSYFVGSKGSLNIASGQTLYDEDGNPYSGNGVTIPDGKTLRPYDCRLDLSNDADNTADIADANGKVYNVTLQGRTLYKDGAWNTLCLPFALGDDQAESGHELDGTPLEGATLMTLGNSQACKTGFDPQTGTLNLDFLPATTVEPGVAYIVKWSIPDGMTADDFAAAYAANPDDYDLKNPVFTGVTVTNDAPADHATTSTDGYITFIGTYGPAAIYADPAVNLYLGAANKLYWPTSAKDINSFRAYFQLNNGLTCGDPTNPNAARAFSLNFGDDEATGIITTNFTNSTNSSNEWYTLDGRKLQAQPTKSGLYIHGGKKVLVRDKR